MVSVNNGVMSMECLRLKEAPGPMLEFHQANSVPNPCPEGVRVEKMENLDRVVKEGDWVAIPSPTEGGPRQGRGLKGESVVAASTPMRASRLFLRCNRRRWESSF